MKVPWRGGWESAAQRCLRGKVVFSGFFLGRSQIDLMISFAPPHASGAGAARRVNLLTVVIPAQNAALGRQVEKARSDGRF